MTALMKRPRGVFPMLYAFFDDRGALDREAFRRQVEVVIQSGAGGVAILGLITEVALLSPHERQVLVDWAVEDVSGRVPLLVTIAGSTLEEATSLARGAERSGADLLVIQPPLGARPGEAELAAFFGAVMGAVNLPVGIQNAPEFLGVGLSLAAIKALAKSHPNFTLMKGEGPVAAVKPYLDALSARMEVFNGRGGLELPDNLRAGCAGIVPAPDCADIQVEIFEAWQAGDEERMDALYRSILPYVVFAMQSIPIAVSYGKLMFARRAGIASACASRIAPEPRQPFFEAAMHRWSRDFGPYRVASSSRSESSPT